MSRLPVTGGRVGREIRKIRNLNWCYIGEEKGP